MVTTLLDELRSGTAPPLMPITVDQLHLMIDSGILHDGDPIELIDGLLMRKDRSARGENLMTHNPRESSGVAGRGLRTSRFDVWQVRSADNLPAEPNSRVECITDAAVGDQLDRSVPLIVERTDPGLGVGQQRQCLSK